MSATITLLTTQLLYDIRNYAYVESHVMAPDDEHRRHMVCDIAADGNADIVARALHLAYARLLSALSPGGVELTRAYTDILALPKAYTICVAGARGHAHTSLLTQLCHKFMVASAMCRWLEITNPAAAGRWCAQADECERDITAFAAGLSRVFSRSLSPF